MIPLTRAVPERVRGGYHDTLYKSSFTLLCKQVYLDITLVVFECYWSQEETCNVVGASPVLRQFLHILSTNQPCSPLVSQSCTVLAPVLSSFLVNICTHQSRTAFTVVTFLSCL